jgi:integrase
MRLNLNGFQATIPTVRIADPRRMFYDVFFIIYSEGKKKQCRYSLGINSLSTQAKRLAQAQDTARALKKWLLLGWDPRKDKYPDTSLLKAETKEKKPTLLEGLKFALEEKRRIRSKYSMYDYDGQVRFIEKALGELSMLRMEADSVSRKDIRTIIATATEQNQWSANSRNKCLTILRALMTVMRKNDIIQMNPAKEIDDLPVLPTEGYKRLTDQERDQVASHLRENHLSFYEYVIFIYQLGIRRTELLQVQIRDIDIQNRILKIRAEVAKTNDFRYVPLTDELLEICMRREIWRLPDTFYLFSDNFLSGETKIHPNTATRWWKTIVIDGMSIDCKMYSLKHKGADDKIMADIPLETLQTIYGHKSILMTERYAREVKKKYAREIIEKAPAFGKVVKMKKAN